MSEEKTCEVMVEFRLNTNGKEDGHKFVPGDRFNYDGYKVKFLNEEGTEKVVVAPTLKKTENEWFKVIK